jgi:hypothetical protein
MLKINVDLFKSYLRHRYPLVLIGFAIFGVAFYFDRDYLYIPLLVGGLVHSFRTYKIRLNQVDWLKSRGLTVQDEQNIAFVKQWELTSKIGGTKYCIKNGGVVKGIFIGILCGLGFVMLFPIEFKAIIANPVDLSLFIFACYLAGIVIGATIYRFLWIHNEKRFKTLTDPFVHLITTDEPAENHI